METFYTNWSYVAKTGAYFTDETNQAQCDIVPLAKLMSDILH